MPRQDMILDPSLSKRLLEMLVEVLLTLFAKEQLLKPFSCIMNYFDFV